MDDSVAVADIIKTLAYYESLTHDSIWYFTSLGYKIMQVHLN